MDDFIEALIVENLQAWYGQAHILHNVSFTVHKGECVAILGRNGSGRTTALRAIMGLMSKRKGSVLVNSVETIDLSPDKIAHLGMGYCPEERGIFASLTCEENLFLPKTLGDKLISVEEIYTLFPALKNRSNSSGGKLSGGEQQMLAIARILLAGAPILLLDEISEGLSPVIIDSLTALILDLKQCGYTILLVEQNLRFASKLADRMYVIEQGHVIEEISKSELHDRIEALEALLEI